ncbi:MAG: hypothetical protein HC860_03215 [Alkalinema sp. RU_4_3]|nr:hypothetical protein [Alkalinema sp. RU_4_3]
MELFFDSNTEILGNLLVDYNENAKLLIRNIGNDRNLSRFDTFNKRFKISWGMKIEFTDNLRITKGDTRACYMMMLKVSDLWFAFEHLLEIASEVIPRDLSNAAKVNPYSEQYSGHFLRRGNKE